MFFRQLVIHAVAMLTLILRLLGAMIREVDDEALHSSAYDDRDVSLNPAYLPIFLHYSLDFRSLEFC